MPACPSHDLKSTERNEPSTSSDCEVIKTNLRGLSFENNLKNLMYNLQI